MGLCRGSFAGLFMRPTHRPRFAGPGSSVDAAGWSTAAVLSALDADGHVTLLEHALELAIFAVVAAHHGFHVATVRSGVLVGCGSQGLGVHGSHGADEPDDATDGKDGDGDQSLGIAAASATQKTHVSTPPHRRTTTPVMQLKTYMLSGLVHEPSLTVTS